MTINGICICPNKYNSSFISQYYDNIDLSTCNICPAGCTCDTTGCSFCGPSAHRLITTNSVNQKICLCGTNFQENSIGLCECIPPYTLDTLSNTCKCSTPFYINTNSGKCICLYFNNPSTYYVYNATDCRLCP
jgi:hypothetical protein